MPASVQREVEAAGEAGGPRAPWWLMGGIVAGALLVVVSLGDAGPLAARLAAVADAAVVAGWMPVAYLLGAIGWGATARPWTRGIAGGRAIAAAVGLAMTLTVSHGAGALGVLSPLAAWVWVGVGIIQLVVSLCEYDWRVPGWAANPVGRWMGVFGAVGVAVPLVAAASPPGALWDSEFGGYDSLSYHLPLPAAWAERGRIVPLEHNVYSYLPGYYEAAVFHLAQMTGGTVGLGDERVLIGSHVLALGMLLLGAWWTGAFASVLAGRAGGGGADGRGSAMAGVAAGALVLVTPWSQVVGSMAYNEPGVIALGAAGLAAACVPGLAAWKRGVLVAVLIGGAAGCKPTAVLLLAPACAMLMAVSVSGRGWKRWAGMYAVGAAVGLAMLSPWMVRNAAHGGNPVFPQAVGLFGTAHWDEAQAARYAGGHRFDGSVGDRAAMLVAPAAGAAPGSPAVVRWRGLTNPQWGLTPWAGLVGCGVLIAWGRPRKVGVVLAGGLVAGLVAWMAFTHLQSRFLVPLLPLFAAGFGAGVWAAGRSAEGVRAGVSVAALALSAAWSVANFSEQRGGHPNGLLVFGTGVFTGELGLEGLGDQVVWAGVNETVPVGEGVVLVGDATPLYLRGPVAYATTWDTHPLAVAMRATPGDPAAWTDALRAGGLEWALVSFAELDRLAASGWSDPVMTAKVGDWVESLGAPARVWPEQGRALYRLGGTR